MQVVTLAKEVSLLASLGAMLARRGHEAESFCDPSLALRFLEGNPDASALLIIDQFEAMAGIEISWEARLLASPERPLYIGLVSRPLNSDQLIEALDCGVDDVLEMPLSADELFARLRAAQRLGDMQRQLVEMATVDGLTGLLNRRAFFQRGERLLQSGATDITATMVDIDHFKRINDAYGHAAGDTALRNVAAQLWEKDAIVGRLGGEEFAILRADSTAQASVDRSEAARQRIADEELVLGGVPVRLTCSFGVAAWRPHDDIDRLLRRADNVLFAAKRTGRNRVLAHDPEMMAGAGSITRGVRRLASGVEEAVLNVFPPDWQFVPDCM